MTESVQTLSVSMPKRRVSRALCNEYSNQAKGREPRPARIKWHHLTQGNKIQFKRVVVCLKRTRHSTSRTRLKILCKEWLDYKRRCLALGHSGMCYSQWCSDCTRVYLGPRYHEERKRKRDRAAAKAFVGHRAEWLGGLGEMPTLRDRGTR